MIKFILPAFTAFFFSGANVAQAQPSPLPFTMSGDFTFSVGSGPVLNCGISVKVISSSIAELTTDPGDPSCATIRIDPVSYIVAFDPGTWPQNFTVAGVRFLDFTSSLICSGNVAFTYDGSSSWDFDDTMMFGPCNFNGYVS